MMKFICFMYQEWRRRWEEKALNCVWASLIRHENRQTSSFILRIHIHQQTAQHQLRMNPNKSFSALISHSLTHTHLVKEMRNILWNSHSPQPAHKYFICHALTRSKFKFVFKMWVWNSLLCGIFARLKNMHITWISYSHFDVCLCMRLEEFSYCMRGRWKNKINA
jgi:hypothetical protein